MAKIKKTAFSWHRIVLLLLVSVFFYSCTVSRPGIETEVKPGIETEVKPGVEIEVKPGIETGVKPGIETGVNPGIETGNKPGVGTEVKPSIETSIKPVVEPTSGLRVIGEVEPVTLIQPVFTLPSRIDTGASTSSLDATEIKSFERDGKKWVRFMITNRRSGETKQMECPLSRKARIKRHGEESLGRLVVKVKAMMGGVELVREFSLADRSDFIYQILIARNFLEGEFVVDVNRKNVTTPMSEK